MSAAACEKLHQRWKGLAINWLVLAADPAHWPEGIQVNGKVPVHFLELWPCTTAGLRRVALVLLCIHPGCLPLTVSQDSWLSLEYRLSAIVPPSRAVKAWWGFLNPQEVWLSSSGADTEGTGEVGSTCLVPSPWHPPQQAGLQRAFGFVQL